jgi:hypothetical protein
VIKIAARLMRSFAYLVQDVGGPSSVRESVQGGHHLRGTATLSKEGHGHAVHGRAGVYEAFVNLGDRDTLGVKSPARCALARYLDRVTATPGDSDGSQIVRQQGRAGDLPRVVEVTADRVLVGHDLYLAPLSPGDLEDRRGQHEPPESISKPVVVG